MIEQEAAVPDVQPLSNGDPRRLDAYEVTGRLGEGGQGVVYLGRSTTETVAIKVLHGRLIEDAGARARFVREVEVTKRVARFCTAQVLHAGMADGRPYIVSEYVPGPSLQQQLEQDGPRRGAALDRLAINTATALAAIHQAGVVHRDFKPGNVLMGPDGPVVIDFGIARALDASGPMTAAASQVVGTPAFMAPEQLAEGRVGPATDMFAWGVTIGLAATGVPPFGNTSIPSVIHRILHEQPDLGALDGRLRDIVTACLVKDPARRPAARDLMDALMGHGGLAAGTVTRASGPGAGAPVAAGPGTGAPSVPGPQDAATELLGQGTGHPPAAAGATGGATEVLPPPGPPGAHAGPATRRLPSTGVPGAATRSLPPAATGGPATGRLPPSYGPSGAAAYPPDPRSAGVTLPPAAPPPRPPAPPRPSGSRGAGGVLAVVVTVLVLIIGVGVVWAVVRHGHGSDEAAAGPTPTQHHTTKKHRKPTHRASHRPAHKPVPPAHTTAAKKSARADPYTPQGLCGDGFKVIDRHGVGAATTYLLYNTASGANCVVTMVPRSTGKTYLGASLQVKGGGQGARAGQFPFYAGPVRLPARGKCVRWGGASKTARWTSGWSHCAA